MSGPQFGCNLLVWGRPIGGRCQLFSPCFVLCKTSCLECCKMQAVTKQEVQDQDTGMLEIFRDARDPFHLLRRPSQSKRTSRCLAAFAFHRVDSGGSVCFQLVMLLPGTEGPIRPIGSNWQTLGSNLRAMASNLEAMASTPVRWLMSMAMGASPYHCSRQLVIHTISSGTLPSLPRAKATISLLHGGTPFEDIALRRAGQVARSDIGRRPAELEGVRSLVG